MSLTPKGEEGKAETSIENRKKQLAQECAGDLGLLCEEGGDYVIEH